MEKTETAKAATSAPQAANSPMPQEKGRRTFKNEQRGGQRGGPGRRGPGRRGGRTPYERARPEFDHKVINVRRVTRVVAGGRRFSFSVALVAGDRKGSVGVGIGKSGDTASAIEKAMRSAKKNMIKVKLNKRFSIPHDVKAKFSSARVLIIPAPGRGMIAGSSVRIVLHLAGIKDVTAKILSGSKNQLNIARATVKALSTFAMPRRTGLPAATNSFAAQVGGETTKPPEAPQVK